MCFEKGNGKKGNLVELGYVTRVYRDIGEVLTVNRVLLCLEAK